MFTCEEVASGDDTRVHATPPHLCDVCSLSVGSTFYDCKTRLGGWGYLCIPCFALFGVGLGTGMGQEYRKGPDGRFYVVPEALSPWGKRPFTLEIPPFPGPTDLQPSPASLPPPCDLPPAPPPPNRAFSGLRLAGGAVLFALTMGGILAGLPLILG